MWVLSNAHPLWRVLLEFGKGIGSHRDSSCFPIPNKQLHNSMGTGLTTAVFLKEPELQAGLREKIQKQTENTKKGEG